MRKREAGVIIKIRDYGENSAILKIFFAESGFWQGFVKSAKSTSMRQIIQLGNLVECDLFVRDEDSLPNFSKFDIIESFIGKIIFDKISLTCTKASLNMLNQFFLEGQPQISLYQKLVDFLRLMASDLCLERLEKICSQYVKFELEILRDLGFGLDLSCCAVSGKNENLKFVSPKTARAISQEKALGYESRLLKLPIFLISKNTKIDKTDLLSALDLTGFFLEKFIFPEKNISEIEMLKKMRFEIRDMVKN